MEICVFLLEMFRSSGVKKQVGTGLVGILRGGCLGCSGVAGNEGCDCNNSLLSCMSFRLESEATGNHLEGN